jgi:hypothetical protein
VVPVQLRPTNTGAQSAERALQSSSCCSAVQVGAVVPHDAMSPQVPVKQPFWTIATWPEGQAGEAVAQVTSPAHVAAGSGMHDERAVSQTKPVPQSLSVEQKPASVQVPSAQKQPAAQFASLVHEKPGWVPLPAALPELPPPAPVEFGSDAWLPSFLLWSPKYNWQPPRRDAVATAIARPTEVSNLFMVGSFLWRAQAEREASVVPSRQTDRSSRG